MCFAGEVGFINDLRKNIMGISYPAKIVRNAVVFLNPEVIVFYKSDKQNQFKEIFDKAVAGLPYYAVPRFEISDDYFESIQTDFKFLINKYGFFRKNRNKNCTLCYFSSDDIEIKTGKRLEGTVFSFRSLLNKIAIAVGNVLMLAVVDKFGYNADVMSKITNNLAKPLIESTTQASFVGGVNYTTLLNVIFFMLTAFGAVGLILQVIPMLFYQFDEKAQEGKLKAFREEKEKREIDELNALAESQKGV